MWMGSDNELVQGEDPEVAVERLTVANAVSRALPNVGSMNINSSKVHIGSKFVSVTQNVINKEVIKERAFGWSHSASGSGARLRCSVAVFVCWALVLCSLLAAYLFILVLPSRNTVLDIGLNESWYLRREEWQARPSYGREFMSLPLKSVIVGHSVTGSCTNKYSCIEKVLEIQEANYKRGLDDICCNFLVGGDGFVFEGRGANVKPAISRLANGKSVSVLFIGDFTATDTNCKQFEHLEVLLDALVKDKVLAEDYTVRGHCQIATFTVSPGPNVMKNLKNLTHWDPVNRETCLPR